MFTASAPLPTLCRVPAPTIAALSPTGVVGYQGSSGYAADAADGTPPTTSGMQRKTVYVNDLPIGQAATWAEAEALLSANGILFTAKPGKAEGPTGFYISGATTEPRSLQPRTERRDSGGRG